MAELKQSTWAGVYPFKPHYFHLQGPQSCQLHYLDEGQGEPVVMLHGNPTWSFYYRNVVQDLKAHYRCLVPDHIGCGLSDKPQSYPYCLKQHIENVLQWLKGIKVDRFHLIVHDWGGAIGMGVATRLPDQIQSMIVLNSAAFLSKYIPLCIKVCRFPQLGSWAIRHLNLFAKAAIYMAVKTPLSKVIREGYLHPYDTSQHRIAIDCFVQDIPMNNHHPTYNILKQIQENLKCLNNKPCLLAWGMQDFCFTPKFLSLWQHYFPQAQVHCFKNAGHYVLEDAHREIEPIIGQFLQQYPIVVHSE